MSDATKSVYELVGEVDGLGEGTADNLEDAGFETVADLLIADVDDLEDVPYVAHERAEQLLELANDVATPAPREVDFEETESVVQETVLPLAVRQGEAVLVGGKRADYYHTRACSVVRGNDLNVRDKGSVEDGRREHCRACQNPEVYQSHGSRSSSDSDLEPLVDSREVVLEASLGEKLSLSMAERMGYANPRYVIGTEDPVEWEAATGDNWQTRRLRMADGIAVDSRTEFDLVLGADEIRIEDPPVKNDRPDAGAPSWRVESVGAVGRASPSSMAKLLGQKQDDQDRPEGDDSWRKYSGRGEVDA